MHRVLTPADYRQTAWKNGGGRTTEIVVHPQAADFAHFAWRVSVADVTKDGPFSIFDGVDRTLVLLRGAGVKLATEAAMLEIRAPFEPVTFSGDLRYDCSLCAGAVQDFNLMVRRAAARGEIHVVRGEAGAVPPARFRLCYAAVGTCECLLPGHVPLRLNERDSLYADASDAAPSVLRVNPLASDAVALVVAIDMMSDADSPAARSAEGIL
jgi:environmental stress-induced protein Ves